MTPPQLRRAAGFSVVLHPPHLITGDAGEADKSARGTWHVAGLTGMLGVPLRRRAGATLLPLSSVVRSTLL
jgi:hypothetical protein